MRYLVSVLERSLKDHNPKYYRLTTRDVDVFGKRLGEVFCIGIGEDDYVYYTCPGFDFGRLSEELSKGMPKEATIMVKQDSEANVPRNLREGYRKIKQELERRLR